MGALTLASETLQSGREKRKVSAGAATPGTGFPVLCRSFRTFTEQRSRRFSAADCPKGTRNGRKIPAWHRQEQSWVSRKTETKAELRNRAQQDRPNATGSSSSSKGHHGKTQAPGRGVRQLLLEPLQQEQGRCKMQSAFGKLQENPVRGSKTSKGLKGLQKNIFSDVSDINVALVAFQQFNSNIQLLTNVPSDLMSSDALSDCAILVREAASWLITNPGHVVPVPDDWIAFASKF
ncbi:hypothetical protein JEQ12_017374 [Ovis aries]|uniref:Uncharacterized protein n=1 Tax=Ovis aries TaxID=9940 RepID=A0A836ADB0_SHEEP|nr:hypothetical protein JEQ12_017374 [Ovis aries]